MTKAEIIDELVEHNQHHGRFYRGPVMVRYMTEHAVDKYSGYIDNILNLIQVFTPDTLDEMLMKQYHGHSIRFWRNLSGFNMYVLNWEPKENGVVLTTTGQQSLNYLKAITDEI